MWKLKVVVQLVLAHIPFGETLNHQLQLMHAMGDEGRMQVRIKAIAEGLDRLTRLTSIEGATVVEVGTGWDALPTLMLYAAGAKRIYTYDHVAHLRVGLVIARTRLLISYADLLSVHFRCPAAVIRERLSRALSACETSLSHFRACTNIIYNAPADASATGLADGSVDIYYSYTVLEHVPEHVIPAIAKEAKRVLKPKGVYYAAIWLHDQYSGFDPTVSPVNFLKYPEWIWALFIKNKISYVNRLRERDFIEILRCQEAKVFKVTSILEPENVRRVKSMKINKRFLKYTPEELAVTFTEIMAGWPTNMSNTAGEGYRVWENSLSSRP